MLDLLKAAKEAVEEAWSEADAQGNEMLSTSLEDALASIETALKWFRAE
jgi:uncharacterized protein (DUF736 family)